MYSKAVEMSSNAIGTLQEQQDIYMESTEAHLKKLSTEAERTYDILFDTNAVNDMSDALTGLLKIFNNFLAGMGGGLQTITGLTAMAGNIFNKQIGAGLNQLAQNRDIERQNEQAVNTAMEFSQVGAANSTSTAEKQVYDQMTEKSKELLGLKNRISTEEMNTLLTLRKEAEQEQLKYKLLEEQANMDVSTEDLRITANNQKDNIKQERLQYAAIKKEIEEINVLRSKNTEEDNLKALIQQEDLLNRMSILDDHKAFSKEQEAQYQSAITKQDDLQLLDETELNELSKIANQHIEEQLKDEQEINRQLELRQQLDEGELERARARAQQKLQALADAQANLERQAAIQDMVKGLTTLVTLGTTLSGI